MTLDGVQQDLMEYDAQFWLQEPGLATLRHVTLHIGKLMGKVSAYCEAMEDNRPADKELYLVDREVIADLVMYAARNADDRGLSLDQACIQRKHHLLQRHASKP